MKNEIKILNDKESLGLFAADKFVELSEHYIKQKGRFSVALSGGSTPKILYDKLVQLYADDVHWNYIDFFWSDERYVPFDHPDSNGGMAYKHLLQPMDISKDRFYPVPTSYPSAAQSAMEYEETIRSYFSTPSSVPAFDLIFLGMGDDGHTASLFPDTKALHETRRIVSANYVDKFDTWRITFTYPLLNQAKHVFFLVGGADKAGVVREIHNEGSEKYPSAIVKPTNGELLWLLDAEAGRELDR
jgi:6-phosphogluconolactonase